MRKPGDSLARAALRALGLAAAMAALAMLSGCAANASGASAVGFVTELDQTDGLANGAPVTYGGDTIGSVTGLGWKLNGDTKVEFDVQSQYATNVHQDSIMVLHAERTPPALELYNANPSGPAAAPGAKIDGASSQRELAALLGARGVAAMTSSLAGMMGALGAAAPGAPPPTATLDQLQRQLAALQAQAAARGSANTAATAAQLHALNQQVQSLQQQAAALGASPQAQQLRDEVNQLAHTLTTPPPPPGSGSTAVTPRVY